MSVLPSVSYSNQSQQLWATNADISGLTEGLQVCRVRTRSTQVVSGIPYVMIAQITPAEPFQIGTFVGWINIGVGGNTSTGTISFYLTSRSDGIPDGKGAVLSGAPISAGGGQVQYNLNGLAYSSVTPVAKLYLGIQFSVVPQSTYDLISTGRSASCAYANQFNPNSSTGWTANGICAAVVLCQ